jgi:hypothetical protein
VSFSMLEVILVALAVVGVLTALNWWYGPEIPT